MNIGINIIWASAEQCFRIVVVFFISIAIARTLGPADYGILATAFAAVGFFGSIALFGLDTVCVREIASSGANGGKIISEILIIRLLLAGLILALTTAWHFSKPADLFADSLLILTLLIPFQVIGSTLGSCFSGRLLNKYPTYALMASLALTTVLRLYGVIQGKNLLFFVSCHFLEYFIGTLVIAFLFLKVFRSQFTDWQPQFADAKQLISGAKWLLMSGLVVQLLQNVGLFFMAAHNPGHDLGNYAAALRLISVTQFMPALIGQSFIPAIGRLHDMESEDLPLYETQLFRCLCLCGYGIALFCLFMGPWILPLLLGEQFAGASPVFSVLALGAIPLSMGAARVAVFSKTRNYTSILICDVTGAAIAAVLSAVLVFHHGSIGVAFSSVAGSLVAYIVLPYFLMAGDKETRHRMFSSFLFPFPNLAILFGRKS